MAAIPTNVRRIVGVLTVLLLGLFGVVWVGANPLGGGVLLALILVQPNAAGNDHQRQEGQDQAADRQFPGF